ncbi:ATP-binding protein [Litoreibacter roseus]|uniref:histidine kinase n=1 Tax=Litoreibacter roseus TaxID=2601869 RepID=A0A6N6JM43_9RHOB|nr:ATP-binding protein [Litoreibacter roseus]GFE66940.1 two-component sensor histidine kinase [Litoreibacter roseus]
MPSSPDLKTVLSGLPLPVLIIDEAYRISHANPAAIEMFGGNALGLNAVTLLRQAPVLAAIDGAIRDNREAEARFLYAGLSGEVAYRFRARPIEDGSGQKCGAVLSFEDHSRVEESENIRRDFVANISHELRTPLTGLTGFIETLRTTARDDPAARDRFLEIMEAEARRMGRLVSDLMSLSRVEADERVRPRDLVDVCAVLRSVVATLEGKLAEADVSVETAGIDKSHQVLGDRDQLIQLFLNLIENAIKYGSAGRVIHLSVVAVARDHTLRCPAVRIDVRDEGPGIDPLHLPRLTERFYRIDDHRSREMGGTGLGLAIVKHIVNRHRGRLKINSKQGVGTTFSVIIPAG